MSQNTELEKFSYVKVHRIDNFKKLGEDYWIDMIVFIFALFKIRHV